MKKPISNILREVAEAPSKKEKLDLLRRNDSHALRSILYTCFDPRVKWLLPPGIPPYRALTENTDQEGQLYHESKHLYLFIEGGNPNLTAKRRIQLFIQMLESLHPDDASLLCSIKDKKMPWKTINVKLIGEAFPGLIKEEEKGIGKDVQRENI